MTNTQICVCIVLFVVFDLRSAAVNLQLFNTLVQQRALYDAFPPLPGDVSCTHDGNVLYTRSVEPTSHMLLGHSDLQSTPEL